MKKIFLVIIVGFLFTFSSRLATGQTASNSETLWVGILIADGSLVPLVQYSDGKWNNSWPSGDRNTVKKLNSLSSIPKSWLGSFKELPKSWNVTSAENRVKYFKVIKPKLETVQCSKEWELSTDYFPVNKKHSWPSPLIGVSVNREDVKVQLPKELDLKSDEGRRLFRFLKEEFQKAGNNKEISKCRIVIVGKKDFHFVINAGESEMNGWAIGGIGDQYSLLEKNVFIPTADSEGYSNLSVLGSIEMDQHHFVVVQTEGYESEGYQMIEITERKVSHLISLVTGGC